MATLLRTPAGRRADALVERVGDGPSLVLAAQAEPQVAPAPPPSEETGRALALSDVIAAPSGPGEALIRWAYRLGIPGHAIAAPFRRPQPLRVLATVESPNRGDRAAGTALAAVTHQQRIAAGTTRAPTAAVRRAGATRSAGTPGAVDPGVTASTAVTGQCM
jgi:hypothetical protein